MIITAISNYALQTPNKIAFRGEQSVFTYADLDAEIARAVIKLQALKPNVLGLAMDNSPAWAILDLAAMQLGIPTVPLPLFFSPEQIAHAIQDAGIDVLMSDQPLKLEDLLNTRHISFRHENPLSVGGKVLTAFMLRTDSFTTRILQSKKNNVIPQATAKITYTSGTTAKSKGVCLSLATMQTVAQSLLKATEAEPTDQHLCILPLSTLLENLAGLYVPLLAGATVIILPLAQVGISGSSGFDSQKFLHAIHTTRATSLILTPELLLALVSAIEAGIAMPEHLRFIAVGGASVSPRLLLRAERLGLPVFEGYGLSECGSVVALNTLQAKKIGSVGKPLSHITIEFDQDGEILVKGASLLAYLGDSHLNVNSDNQTQYLPTGDIGFLDEDGFLHITGRKKNIFITSFGRNVAPEWVERELTLMPCIKQAALFGEAMPHNTAIIVAADNAIKEKTKKSIQDAIDQVNLTLPDYARVSQWQFADTPFTTKNEQLTSNGRLRRENIWQVYRTRIEALTHHKETQHAVL